jgi:hypothetical protein
MKKTIGFLLLSLAFTSFASAASFVECKEVGAAIGQGYEIKLIANSPTITLRIQNSDPVQMKKVAKPKVKSIGPKARPIEIVYQEPLGQGYRATVSKGGFTGMTTVLIAHGGFNGYQPLATLICE